MKQEVEYIAYPKIKHIKLFFDEVRYRNQHLHPEFELCFMLKGQAYFKTSKNEFLVKENDIILINGGEAHFIEAKEESALGLFIQVSNHFLMEYDPILRNEEFETCLCSSFFNKNELNEIFSLGINAAKSYFKEDKCDSFSTISSIADIFNLLLKKIPHNTLSEKERERKKRNFQRIMRVISYCEEHLQEKIKLSDIAEKENITTTYLSHLFSENFGMTFQDYLNSKRFEEAIRLVSNSDRSMIEISEACGFSDQKYMSKMFVDKFNMTPKKFANSSKKLFIKSDDTKRDVLERIYSDEESKEYLKKMEESNNEEI